MILFRSVSFKHYDTIIDTIYITNTLITMNKRVLSTDLRSYVAFWVHTTVAILCKVILSPHELHRKSQVASFDGHAPFLPFPFCHPTVPPALVSRI